MNTEVTTPPKDRSGRTACIIVYSLYIAAPLMGGVPWLAGLIVAYVWRSGAAPEIAAHLNYAVRLGWVGLVWAIIALVVTVILIVTLVGTIVAWLPGFIWWIWSLIKSLKALMALTGGKPPPG